jgi:hypothetical protein
MAQNASTLIYTINEISNDEDGLLSIDIFPIQPILKHCSYCFENIDGCTCYYDYNDELHRRDYLYYFTFDNGENGQIIVYIWKIPRDKDFLIENGKIYCKRCKFIEPIHSKDINACLLCTNKTEVSIDKKREIIQKNYHQYYTLNNSHNMIDKKVISISDKYIVQKEIYMTRQMSYD